MARKVTTKTIGAKVTLEEFGLICQRAGQANKTISAYVNDLIFAPPAGPAAKGSVKALKDEVQKLKNECDDFHRKWDKCRDELVENMKQLEKLNELKGQLAKSNEALIFYKHKLETADKNNKELEGLIEVYKKAEVQKVSIEKLK